MKKKKAFNILLKKEKHGEQHPAFMNIGKHIKAQHFQNILNDSPDGLVIFDLNNFILEWNKGAADIFGYSRDEVIGRKFDFLIPADLKKDGEIERMQEMIEKEGYIKNHQTHRIRKDRRKITVEITRTPIRDKKNKIIAYTALVRDKSQFIELNNMIRQTEKLAAVGELIAGFAHEIGTPLNIIVGNAELMLMELEHNDPNKIYLEKVIATAERVGGLIKRMLQLSSPNKIKEGPVNINKILEDLYIFLRKQLEKNNIEVSLQLSSSVPLIMGDASQLEEVFLNLMMNAWHAMPEGGKIIVKTSLLEENGRPLVNVRISDTGIGIPAEIMPRIFEPFFTTKDPQKGTGLGLYLAHKIVEKHRGKIVVRSKSRKGTIFHVFFPVSDEGAPADQHINMDFFEEH